MMKKNALGRGLDALMPQADYQDSVRDIPVTLIDISQSQPRKAFDQAGLEQLADSIRQVGMLQPVLVVESAGRYRIVAGERRFRAARLAGLTFVPCMQKNFAPQEAMLAALIENLQREDLNPIEEANAIHLLMVQGGLTQQDAAQRLGKSRPAVANVLRLLSLPPAVQELVSQGSLSQGHARVLAGLKGAARQEALARRVVLEDLSVRTLEKLCQAPQDIKPSPAARLAPELKDFAERLQRATGLRAKIQGDLQQGTITLRYTSAQELEGLYEALEQILP